jgi:hypothetical protein
MTKRIALTVILILTLAAGGVWAHEKGDLSLGIEPHLGMSFPPFQLLLEGLIPGLDFGLQTTLHYNFTKSFSANVGLGYTANYHWYFSGENSGLSEGYDPIFEGDARMAYILMVPMVIEAVGILCYSIANLPKAIAGEIAADHNVFFGSYFTIPFGLNYAFKAVSLGGGLTANIPIYGTGKLLRKPYEQSPTFETVTFELLPYLGWYLDIGFPRKKSPDRYATLIRLNGSFFPVTAEPSSKDFRDSWEPFLLNFFSISAVFKFGIPLTNVGGNKE